MTNLENLPEELRKSALFCCWRYEERNGRKTKVPYNPTTGRRAASNDMNTFDPLSVAVQAADQYDGLGVGIFGTLGAIDIDHCLTNNAPSELAKDIVQTMNTYTEISPSGEGLRLLFWVPPGFQYDTERYYINNQKAGLEVYIAGATQKYVTVTGNVWGFDQMAERSGELVTVLEKYMVRPQVKQAATVREPCALDDLALIQRAQNAKNGTTFSRLWAGDITGYKSHSEADIALCNMLAFWTGKDPGQMDRLFRQSALMREKWDRKQSGSTYGALTIQNAVQQCREVYTPRGQAVQQKDGEGFEGEPDEYKPRLIWLDTAEYTQPIWLIKPYFEIGTGTLIQADNGMGKTMLMCAIAAHVTTGKPIMDTPVQTPGKVLMFSTEDEAGELLGRIESAGGDPSKVAVIENAAGLTFESDFVLQTIRQVKPVLVLFDPMQAFMPPSVQMDKANQTRPVLAKLAQMARHEGFAAAIIAHTGKASGDKSAVNKSLGSVDIPAAMRSILHVMNNPENPTEKAVLHVKCSHAAKGQGLSYRIENFGGAGGVVWTGYNSLSEQDIDIANKRKNVGIDYEQEPLVTVFNRLISENPAGGFMSYADLKEFGAKVLDFPPFSNSRELSAKLDSGLARELQLRDHLIVTHGKKRNGVRGVTVERYIVPEDCRQETIRDEDPPL